MTRPRYLTKSRFALATECPAKLYYTGKEDIYPNKKLDDEFLAALAKGGFQVGELAKHYYPGGVEIRELGYEASLEATNALLAQEQAIVFEAAVRYENLFIRVDILVKNGSRLEIYEVKAKSTDSAKPRPFLNNKTYKLNSKWKSYLYDVAFQKYVVQKAFPNMTVSAHLMLTDKSEKAPTDGLNQKFRVMKDANGGRCVVVSQDIDDNDLSVSLLKSYCVDDVCDLIYNNQDAEVPYQRSFSGRVQHYSDHYARDERIFPECGVSTACASCEFRATPEEETEGKKNGFKECWTELLNWKDNDFDDPTVLEIWNFGKKNELLSQGKIKLSSLEKSDIGLKVDDKPGLHYTERQWLQVKKAVTRDDSPWIDESGLRAEMERWKYPLHFIDFETTMVAIPFNKGRRPYEGVAFQFSHHIVHEDGRIEHKGQYLNAEPGVFPNYDFLRALKAELDQDQGTIFRYASHENTYLNHIYEQLTEETDVLPDKKDLIDFIKSISHSKKEQREKWVGERDMVDMLELVKRYYYDPATKGSNSIKYVLPAILKRSEYLQKKYATPIYGAVGGIRSHNFTDWVWVRMESGVVANPYELLPRMFEDVSEHDLELLMSEDDEIREGGAAMTAWARMQFEEMTDIERQKIKEALLKYCELDTLAMVMIYEEWVERIGSVRQ